MQHTPKNKLKNPIKDPKYPGGKKALDEFVRSELKYPEAALEARVGGTVFVEYDVDVFGAVIDAKVKHGLGYGCDEEALRIVKLLKFEKKIYKGLRVVFHMKINIHFRLPGITNVQALPQINYQYKPKDDNTLPGYTINLS